MKMKIEYLSEISKEYTQGVRNCKNPDSLKVFLDKWREFCQDAIEKVESKNFSWKEYQKGEKLERQRRYVGDEWVKNYSMILLPKIILFIGLKAAQLKVPEGAMFIRLKEVGILKRDRNGYFQIKE